MDNFYESNSEKFKKIVLEVQKNQKFYQNLSKKD